MENTTPNTVKNSQIVKGPTLSTQTYLRISEIRDNTVILKNGGLRAALKVNSINFSLKSEDEQNAIIYSYQGFLNSLEDPIQIVIRSKKLDIDHYIAKVKDIATKQSNQLLKKQTVEYADYIQKLVEYADIMEKQFYVIVSQDPPGVKDMNFFIKFFSYLNAKDSFQNIKIRRQEFEELKKKLNQKVSSIKIGLENCGLKAEDLKTSDLVKLFYECYNPVTSRFEKGEEYSTSKITTDEELKIEDSGT